MGGERLHEAFQAFGVGMVAAVGDGSAAWVAAVGDDDVGVVLAGEINAGAAFKGGIAVVGEEAVGDAYALVFGYFVWLAFAQAGGEVAAHFMRCFVEQ